LNTEESESHLVSENSFSAEPTFFTNISGFSRNITQCGGGITVTKAKSESRGLPRCNRIWENEKQFDPRNFLFVNHICRRRQISLPVLLRVTK
jgi:hypothetical protein